MGVNGPSAKAHSGAQLGSQSDYQERAPQKNPQNLIHPLHLTLNLMTECGGTLAWRGGGHSWGCDAVGWLSAGNPQEVQS